MASSLTSPCSISTVLDTLTDCDMPSHDRLLTVTLDAEDISQEMAARLAIALLGQMLYMKGQVPFPVASLSRMVGRQAVQSLTREGIRAAKKRKEFLEAYDDLSSHLRTTFVAFSTALAQNQIRHSSFSPSTPTSPTATKQDTYSAFTKSRRHPAKVHVLFVLGPSPSAAKARVLLELDGLRVERFGEREHLYRNRNCEAEESDELSECGSGGDLSAQLSRPLITPPRKLYKKLGESDLPRRPSLEACADSDGPPPSSPPPSDNSSFSDDDGLSIDEELIELPGEVHSLPDPHHVEETLLRAGERLLSRALFTGEGLGFGNEICECHLNTFTIISMLPPSTTLYIRAPRFLLSQACFFVSFVTYMPSLPHTSFLLATTQVHVLIRAPRRFSHPTWIPRQSLGHMLDRQVRSFLDSEPCSGGGNKTVRGFGVGCRTVGVRVKCRSEGVREVAEMNLSRNTKQDSDNEEIEDEGDELIWWSWDRKLVGFSD
ncbi:hypothetical protein K439DRAFT_298359 [Ramaria rubella]|nr:hypothetical protein K439DRAFT_298359 [Ramaria rubella]